MASGSRVAVALSLAAISAAWVGSVHATDTAGSDQISRLAGRWAGPASMVPSSGPNRDFKCVVVYLAEGDGTHLKQKLRCKSADYKLEAATVLQISGSEVTGRWEDPVNSIGGDVKGIVTAGGFDVHLGGRFFQAKLEVNGTGCEQQVKLTPVRADYIKELSANLKKC